MAKSSILPLVLGAGALLLVATSMGGGKGASGKGPRTHTGKPSPDPRGATGGSKPQPADIPEIAASLDNAVAVSRDAAEASDIAVQEAASSGSSSSRMLVLQAFIEAHNALSSLESDLEALYLLVEELATPPSMRDSTPQSIRIRAAQLNDAHAQLSLHEPILMDVAAVARKAEENLARIEPLTAAEVQFMREAGYAYAETPLT